MPTEISGSTGVNKIQDGTVVNADINSSAAIAGSKLVMPTGSTLQAVQITGGGRTTISSTGSWTNHIALSITPSSTSSKILIQITQPFVLQGTSNLMRGALRLRRGSTTIWNTGDFTEHFQFRNADTEGAQIASIAYLDSPSTTSSTTYTLQGYLTSGNQLLLFENSFGCNMILTEIAG